MTGTSWRPLPEPPTPQRPPARRFGLARVTALLALAACGGPGEPRPELHFADFVDHQAHQVSTRRIAPEDAAAEALLGAGWYRVEAEGGGHELVHRPRRSSLQFFSADGGAQGLEIAYPAPLPVTLAAQVNGQWAGRLVAKGGRFAATAARARGGTTTYRVAFPEGTVRPGWNVVRLLIPGDEPLELPKILKAGEIRFLPLAAPGPTPTLHRVGDAGEGSDGEPGRFVMPADSWLDLVATLPDAPRWDGRFAVRLPEGARPLTLRAELLDEAGESHVLYERTLEESDRGERFALDLSPWARQRARLRLAALGGGDGEVRWHLARVRGKGDGWSPPLTALDPIHEPASSGRLGRPDVVVIVLDAARADAFGAYGAPHPTPAIDALASEGTRFAGAHASVPWTGPSIPAILSGLYPDSLGIEHWNSRLRPGVKLVPETFADAGYHTVLWSQHPFYRDRSALRRGFETFHSSREWVGVAPDLADFLDDDRPTFAFVHLLPPHTPYRPPEPFLGAYTAGYDGTASVDVHVLNQFPARRDPDEVSAEDRAFIFARYLEMVAFADSLVGQVVDSLKRAGRYDDALIMVLSDHGEAFLEHDFFLHSRRLYQEFLDVPWVVKWPAGTTGFARVVESPVSSVDLTPTLIDALGLPPAGHLLQGRSLLPQVFGGAPGRPGIYAVTRGAAPESRWPQPAAAISADGWKLLHDLEFHRLELYDLSADPGETTNLADRHPLHAAELAQLLHRQRFLNRLILSGLGTAEAGEIDPEVERQLKALGYL